MTPVTSRRMRRHEQAPLAAPAAVVAPPDAPSHAAVVATPRRAERLRRLRRRRLRGRVHRPDGCRALRGEGRGAPPRCRCTRLGSATCSRSSVVAGDERARGRPPSIAAATPSTSSRSPRPRPRRPPRRSRPRSPAGRPPFVTPDPGSAQAIAYEMVLARGWGDDQFACLVALWNKESGWRVNAYNAVERCVRHPAGASRQQDGQRRRRLGDQCRDADHVGPRLHRRPLRHAVRRVGPLAEHRLVLTPMPRSNRRRPEPHGDDSFERLLAGWKRTEMRRGVEWTVQPVSALAGQKPYICPGLRPHDRARRRAPGRMARRRRARRAGGPRRAQTLAHPLLEDQLMSRSIA